MGKRRQTAKTGDKALYKSRPSDATTNKNKNDEDNDNIYNAVDRFHNRQDFLKLDGGGSESESEEDDGISNRQGVLNLAGGETSSSEDEDSDDDSVEEALAAVTKKRKGETPSSSDDDSSDSSDDDDNDLEMEQSDVRDWGSKKSVYYHGDTADLEIGQDEDDAFLEEEAAKEVQAARYEQMAEDDFVMSSDDDEDATDKTETTKETAVKSIDMRGTRDLSKLSKSDRRRLLQSHHPELLPLVSHFKHAVQEWDERTSVVAKAVLEGDEGTIEAIGATPAGVQYLVSKALLQSSTALNVAMYLLLKSEQAITDGEADADNLMDGDAVSAIQSHPVIARLQQLNKLSQKLQDRVETKVDTLNEQMDTLVKANDLIGTVEDDSESSKQNGDDSAVDGDREEDDQRESPVAENAKAQVSKHASSSSSSEDESEDDIATSVINDAKFGLRPQELGAPRQQKGTKRSRRAVPLDYGDEDDTGLNTKATQSLASTINAIEQRSATRSRKKRSAATTETLDEQDEDNDALRRGLEMMEAELGRLESDDEKQDNTELDEELNDDPDEDDFYKSVKERSKAKKQRKAAMYTVAPKYPGMDHEIQGERAISKTIMKNRGLVAHKSKLNRNPRVKKREQYRKALVRRKGHVRDVRTEEGHQYGGEETGIKSGLSRSRKLGT